MRTDRFAVGLMLLALFSMLATSCQGVSPKKVKIVAVTPLNRSYGKAMQNSFKLALDEAGYKAGSIPVELVIVDSTDPKINPDDDAFAEDLELKLIPEFIDDPEVVVFIGSIGSGQAKKTMPVLNKAGLAHVTLSASWPGLTKPGFGPGEPGIFYPTGVNHFFRVGAADDVQGVAAARWASKLGFKKVFVLAGPSVYSTGLAAIFVVNAKDEGLEIVGEASYEIGVTDAEIARLAAQVKESGADLLYYPENSGPEPGRLLTAFKTAVPDLTLMGGDGMANQMIGDMPPEILEGMLATDISILARDLDTEKAQAFTAKYKSVYGEELTSTLGTNAYEVIGLVLEAIATAEQPTRRGVLERLQKIEYSGIFGNWHFDENGDMVPAFIACMKVENNAWKLVEVCK